MEPLPDEPALLEQARAGDLAAFNALVEHYQGAVYNLCLRMLGAQQAAEDATQEAFIAAFRNLRSFRGGAFRSWMFRIASNTCYDDLRRRRSRRAESLDEARSDERQIDPPQPGPAPEELAEQAELRVAVHASLARLPDDQRLAVILCDLQGLDYAEISRVMQCSLGTVKSRINRGRLRMRDLLQEHGELLPERFRHTGENK
jgi:RNA polymerase sigma-70 factor (ECF subfamily)